jgi:hypothetical protein
VGKRAFEWCKVHGYILKTLYLQNLYLQNSISSKLGKLNTKLFTKNGCVTGKLKVAVANVAECVTNSWCKFNQHSTTQCSAINHVFSQPVITKYHFSFEHPQPTINLHNGPPHLHLGSSNGH